LGKNLKCIRNRPGHGLDMRKRRRFIHHLMTPNQPNSSAQQTYPFP
jgi:hypothetical protein